MLVCPLLLVSIKGGTALDSIKDNEKIWAECLKDECAWYRTPPGMQHGMCAVSELAMELMFIKDKLDRP